MQFEKLGFVTFVKYLFALFLSSTLISYLVSPRFTCLQTYEKKNITLKRTQALLDIPMIYVITPTYTRPEQKSSLTRLAQTLNLVLRLHWIVVEDSKNKTELVSKLLERSRIPYTYLFVNTMKESEWRKLGVSSDRRMPRGVEQRNTALDWIKRYANHSHVVYFADDDNTYDRRIFEEMRSTKTVSVWPVGLVGGVKYESPAVKNGKVVGWIVAYGPWRKFALDMAGFAVNGDLLKKIPTRFSLTAKPGTVESLFLSSLKIKMDQLEPKAKNCTQVLVWHTQNEPASLELDKIRVERTKRFNTKELDV